MSDPIPAAAQPASVPGAGFSRLQSIVLTGINLMVAVLLAIAGWAANQAGIFFNALFVFVLVMVPVRVALIVGRLFFRSLEHRLWTKPLAGELRRYWWQVVNRWIFWLLAALTLETCLVPAQFSPHEYSNTQAMIWGGILTLMLLELLPGKRIYLATNLALAAGSVFMATQMARIYWPAPQAEGVVLAAPFRGEWLVIQGGRSTLINHHYGLSSQRDALDIERLVNGQERTGDRKQLESYPSWGQPLYAPADGRIVTAVNDLADNEIGGTDTKHLAGNHIVMDIGNGHFVMMAHLQKGSVHVAPGDRVHAGQPIAKCGNSGNTTQPHLHIQAQNQPDFFAAGAKTYPILFRDVTCLRFQHPRVDAPFFVRRNDRIISGRAID